MTFEAFVDLVDDRVRARTTADYGLYRGPHVAFWHLREISIRLRAGTAGDAELEIAGPGATTLVVALAAEGAVRVAETIASVWDAAQETGS